MPRQPKIDQDRGAVGSVHDVLRLDISVDEGLRLQMSQRVTKRNRKSLTLRTRETAALQTRMQGASGNKFFNKINEGVTFVIDRAYIKQPGNILMAASLVSRDLAANPVKVACVD